MTGFDCTTNKVYQNNHVSRLRLITISWLNKVIGIPSSPYPGVRTHFRSHYQEGVHIAPPQEIIKPPEGSPRAASNNMSRREYHCLPELSSHLKLPAFISDVLYYRSSTQWSLGVQVARARSVNCIVRRVFLITAYSIVTFAEFLGIKIEQMFDFSINLCYTQVNNFFEQIFFFDIIDLTICNR